MNKRFVLSCTFGFSAVNAWAADEPLSAASTRAAIEFAQVHADYVWAFVAAALVFHVVRDERLFPERFHPRRGFLPVRHVRRRSPPFGRLGQEIRKRKTDELRRTRLRFGLRLLRPLPDRRQARRPGRFRRQASLRALSRRVGFEYFHPGSGDDREKDHLEGQLGREISLSPRRSPAFRPAALPPRLISVPKRSPPSFAPRRCGPPRRIRKFLFRASEKSPRSPAGLRCR